MLFAFYLGRQELFLLNVCSLAQSRQGAEDTCSYSKLDKLDTSTRKPVWVVVRSVAHVV